LRRARGVIERSQPGWLRGSLRLVRAAASAVAVEPVLSVRPAAAVLRRAGAQRGPPLVEHRDALLDAGERLHEVALEADEDVDRVLVGSAPDLVRVALRPLDDREALRVGGLGEAALVDEERRLLLRAADDPLGFLLRLLDDPLALGVDPLRGADLLGDGCPKLVDEAERRVLVDDDVARERQLLAVREQRLEALDEEDDVDRSGPPMRRASETRGVGRDYRTGFGALKCSPSARTAAGGTSAETSPPNVAISFARLELT
jgi:hypothetical protein